MYVHMQLDCYLYTNSRYFYHYKRDVYSIVNCNKNYILHAKIIMHVDLCR